jgi:hypothetical protein
MDDRWGLLSVKERHAALLLFAEYRRLKQRSLERPPWWTQDQLSRRKWANHLRDVRARMQKLVGREFAQRYKEWAVMEAFVRR